MFYDVLSETVCVLLPTPGTNIYDPNGLTIRRRINLVSKLTSHLNLEVPDYCREDQQQVSNIRALRSAADMTTEEAIEILKRNNLDYGELKFDLMTHVDNPAASMF